MSCRRVFPVFRPAPALGGRILTPDFAETTRA